MANPPITTPAAGLLDSIENFIKTAILPLEPSRDGKRGRPLVIPAVALWSGMLVCVARGFSSQLELWRLLSNNGLWDFGRLEVSDDAIYARLKKLGRESFRAIFEQVTRLLKGQRKAGPPEGKQLASFAAGVYALDETTLDAIKKRLPSLRDIKSTVLAGKLTCLFDIRAQLWHHIEFQDDPRQNEKVAARSMLDYLSKGSLILADLGYFAFQWFDTLTNDGFYWVSRLRGKTSYTLKHTLYQRDAVLDAIVWLGKYRADRAANAVRLVRFSRNGKTWVYITNVLDPSVLSIAEIGRLYSRRWDIEMMFNMIKTHLKLNLIWPSHINVVLHQVYAVFSVAQIILGIRSEIARKAQADEFEVSLDLMIRWLPRIAADGNDPIQVLVERGRFVRIIRPSTRIRIDAPNPPISDYSPLPVNLSLLRTPRYAGKL